MSSRSASRRTAARAAAIALRATADGGGSTVCGDQIMEKQFFMCQDGPDDYMVEVLKDNQNGTYKVRYCPHGKCRRGFIEEAVGQDALWERLPTFGADELATLPTGADVRIFHPDYASWFRASVVARAQGSTRVDYYLWDCPDETFEHGRMPKGIMFQHTPAGFEGWDNPLLELTAEEYLAVAYAARYPTDPGPGKPGTDPEWYPNDINVLRSGVVRLDKVTDAIRKADGTTKRDLWVALCKYGRRHPLPAPEFIMPMFVSGKSPAGMSKIQEIIDRHTKKARKTAASPSSSSPSAAAAASSAAFSANYPDSPLATAAMYRDLFIEFKVDPRHVYGDITATCSTKRKPALAVHLRGRGAKARKVSATAGAGAAAASVPASVSGDRTSLPNQQIFQQIKTRSIALAKDTKTKQARESAALVAVDNAVQAKQRNMDRLEKVDNAETKLRADLARMTAEMKANQEALEKLRQTRDRHVAAAKDCAKNEKQARAAHAVCSDALRSAVAEENEFRAGVGMFASSSSSYSP